MSTSAAKHEFDPHKFWTEAFTFWPYKLEQQVANRWWVLIALPVGAAGILTVGYRLFSRQMPAPMGVGYLASLCIALTACGVLFQSWEARLRDAFGRLYSRGLVDGTLLADYQIFSEQCQQLYHSRLRWIPISLCVAFTVLVNAIVGLYIVGGVLPSSITDVLPGGLLDLIPELSAPSGVPPRVFLIGFGVTMGPGVLAWSYAVGAVAWCFIASGYAIWQLPSVVRLRVRYAHPDRCGGLRDFGDCCLGTVYPVLVGVLLLALWSAPALLPWMVGTADHSLARTYGHLMLIVSRVTTAAVLATGLTALAALWPMHREMSDQRRTYSDAYSALVDEEARAALVGGLPTKARAEDFAAAEAFSPQALKMGDWPVDWVSLAKYVAAIVGALATFNQNVLTVVAKALGW